MLAGQRQMLIVEEIRRRGAVRVSELTELLDVSDMTIRRDLDVLASSGLVEKVHGGATRRGGSGDRPDRGDDDVAARPPHRPDPRPHGGDELDPGRERAAPRRA